MLARGAREKERRSKSVLCQRKSSTFDVLKNEMGQLGQAQRRLRKKSLVDARGALGLASWEGFSTWIKP